MAFILSPTRSRAKNWGLSPISQIAARFTPDCLALKPRYAIISAGVNDATMGKATFLRNWAVMLDSCQENGIIPIILKFPPHRGKTDDEMREWDDWMNALVSLAASYPDAVIVQSQQALGQYRAGGDPGNLWDWQPQYNSGDNTHPGPLGCWRWADEIISAGAFNINPALEVMPRDLSPLR